MTSHLPSGNDVMISEMKAQQSSAPFSPSLERRRASEPERKPSFGSASVSINASGNDNGSGSGSGTDNGNGLHNGPSNEMASDSNRSSPRAKALPSGASAGQEDKALALLSELRSCMTEVSGVREVFRDLSSENQVFLRQLVGELNPESAKSSSSIHTIGSGKSVSLHGTIGTSSAAAVAAAAAANTASAVTPTAATSVSQPLGCAGPELRARRRGGRGAVACSLAASRGGGRRKREDVARCFFSFGKEEVPFTASRARRGGSKENPKGKKEGERLCREIRTCNGLQLFLGQIDFRNPRLHKNWLFFITILS